MDTNLHKIGWKVFNKNNGRLYSVSMLGVKKNYGELSKGTKVVRGESEGPFAIFTSEKAAEAHISILGEECFGSVRIIREVNYIQSEEKVFWFIEHGTKVYNRGFGEGFNLPKGTDFADEFIII